ncbi:FecR family protein [Barnesiella viscericola]|uniref:FecR family protein n=1 Tax=Barnesiella viscericola TaxID=397865 RepID=UPI0023522419|nr:FecR family protein [Barnesiella viscericola]
MGNQDNIDELLAKYFAHERLTAAQQAKIDQWRAAYPEESQRLQRLLDTPIFSDTAFEVDTEKAWARIEPQLKEHTLKINLFHKKAWFYSAAAAIALVLVAALLYLSHETDTQTVRYADITQTENVLLPDGSEVTLYPHSTLAFRYADDGIARQVELTGKAFFHVKNRDNAPFKISTPSITVEVLGTSFLVDAAHDSKSGVFVESGRVKVSTSHNNVILEANEKVEVTDGQMTLGLIENPAFFFGKGDSVLVFKNSPIATVVQEVERQTGVKIELGKGLEKNRVTSKINASEKESIAAELAFLCGCRCDTVEKGRLYKLYYE